MSPYAQHLIISTGNADWTSRIEDEKDTAAWGKFTADVRAMLGRGGEFHDAFNNILISTSSFAPLQTARHNDQSGRSHTAADSNRQEHEQDQTEVDGLLFPSFQHFRHLLPSSSANRSSTPGSDSPSADPRNFIRSHLLPRTLHPIYGDLSESERRAKTRDTSSTTNIPYRDIHTPTILICGHGQRDSRCGILGPLLRDEFRRYIAQRQQGGDDAGVRLLVPDEGPFVAGRLAEESRARSLDVNVGLISHIGGHKWAGNVILYIPPSFPGHQSPERHALAGKGIWYGRVEPRHVEGIVEQTVLRGKVIADLFRGGIDQSQRILRL